jgi:hypothetical protein
MDYLKHFQALQMIDLLVLDPPEQLLLKGLDFNRRNYPAQAEALIHRTLTTTERSLLSQAESVYFARSLSDEINDIRHNMSSVDKAQL